MQLPPQSLGALRKSARDILRKDERANVHRKRRTSGSAAVLGCGFEGRLATSEPSSTLFSIRQRDATVTRRRGRPRYLMPPSGIAAVLGDEFQHRPGVRTNPRPDAASTRRRGRPRYDHA